MRKKISFLCMAAGFILIVAAVALAGYNFWEENRAAEFVDSILPDLHQAIAEHENSVEKESQETNESALNSWVSGRMTVIDIDGYGYIGYLSIPELELELPVMSEWDYDRLEISPCLYYGSVKTDNMIIAAHNYARFFRRLSELKPGDAVWFTDMDGIIYTYKVGDIEILSPTATEEMIVNDWDLTLYTCTFGGGSRVTVRCEKN